MGDLSAHFSKWEFADHRTGEWHCDTKLLGLLEAMRSRIGRPVRIVSGFRSVETNRLVGGAPNSYHLKSMAADLERGVCSLALAKAVGFTGIGVCGGWAVHVDVRPGPVTTFPDC